MPQSALDHVKVDYSLPLRDIPALLVRLTSRDVVEPARPIAASETVEVEVKIAKEQNALSAGLKKISEPSSFACPECHGVLLKLKEGGPIRFRCHTGHAYSLETLLAGINEGIEETLWSAIRALEEGEMLLNSITEHLASHDGEQVAALRGRAREARQQSDHLRTLLTGREPLALKS
jgi:two-component system chemotaxis response regulator CheB